VCVLTHRNIDAFKLNIEVVAVSNPLFDRLWLALIFSEESLDITIVKYFHTSLEGRRIHRTEP